MRTRKREFSCASGKISAVLKFRKRAFSRNKFPLGSRSRSRYSSARLFGGGFCGAVSRPRAACRAGGGLTAHPAPRTRCREVRASTMPASCRRPACCAQLARCPRPAQRGLIACCLPDAERRLSKEDAKGLMHTWLLRWQISRRRATAAQRKIWKMNLFCSVLELISASY